MPEEDYNFGGYFGLDFRKWWRQVQPNWFIFDGIVCMAPLWPNGQIQ